MEIRIVVNAGVPAWHWQRFVVLQPSQHRRDAGCGEPVNPLARLQNLHGLGIIISLYFFLL